MTPVTQNPIFQVRAPSDSFMCNENWGLWHKHLLWRSSLYSVSAGSATLPGSCLSSFSHFSFSCHTSLQLPWDLFYYIFQTLVPLKRLICPKTQSWFSPDSVQAKADYESALPEWFPASLSKPSCHSYLSDHKPCEKFSFCQTSCYVWMPTLESLRSLCCDLFIFLNFLKIFLKCFKI